MAPMIWIDGQYYDKANAKVSVFDHGLLYGDGVFEGIRVYDRRVFRLDKHLDRLYHSAKGVWLEVPMAKVELRRLVEQAVAKSGLADAYIRLVVTRGVGDLGLDPAVARRPLREGPHLPDGRHAHQPPGESLPAHQVAQLPVAHPR